MAKTAQEKTRIKKIEKEKRETIKAARKKTAEELFERSLKAWKDPKLVEIVQNVPINKDGRINLTEVYDRVFEYFYCETADVKLAKEYAVATRFLAMYKRDYPTDFQYKLELHLAVLKEKERAEEKVAASEPKLEPKPEPKDIELELFGDIITKINRNLNRPDYSLRISKSDTSDSIIFICNIIEFITGVKQPATYKSKEVENYTYYLPFRGFPEELAIEYLRGYLVQILEEKIRAEN